MCSHERVVRLYVPDEAKVYWICTTCNAQFIEKSAVDYKLQSLVAEVTRLQGAERIVERLVDSLAAIMSIAPGDWHEEELMLEQWRLVKGEQGAGVWREEVL